MGMMDRIRGAIGSRQEVFLQDEPGATQSQTPSAEAVARNDYTHIRSLVGLPESQRYELHETQGEVNLYRHEATGSRINVGTKGEFYDGELRQIDVNEASSLQRMTQEWQSHPNDNFKQLRSHLERFAAPETQRFIDEQKLEGMHQATPEQQAALTERLQSNVGLGRDSALLAMIKEVTTQKEHRGIDLSSEDQIVFERYDDALRGKAGSYYMQELREQSFALSKVGPALEKYALDNSIGVDKLSEEQVRHVGLQTARAHQIPEGVAIEQAQFSHFLQERDIQLHSYRLKTAVGETHAEHYTWKQTTGGVESYQHNDTGRYLHIDREGNFYNQAAAHIDKAAAINHAESFPPVDQINAVTNRAFSEKSVESSHTSASESARAVYVQAQSSNQVEQSLSL